MSFNIVIAKYNEDISWAKPFKNVIVYNKGEINMDFQPIISLSNVGREGHTFYRYIYDNYDNLAEYTMFLQGNPFDHKKDIVDTINKYLNKTEPIPDFAFLSDKILECNLTGCKWHGGLPLKEVYEKIFGEAKDSLDFDFGAGGQFIVSRKNILKRPREFYLKIVKLLERDVNPIEGFVVERFHGLVLK
jgi:hypothetical protein